MARILVVDDDHDVLKLVETVLASHGHIVFTADSAYKAMELLEVHQFDLLISDAQMPHVSGFELVQTVRRNPRYESLAIAMLTGLRERKDIDRAVKAGVNDYIVKPIDPLILIQKIASLFEKKPPEQHPEAFLSDNDPQAVAYVKTPFQILSVSELGLVVRSPWPLSPGQFVDLQSTFFDALGVEAPPLKVLSTDSTAGDNRAQLIFLGAREAFLQKVRRYIFSHRGSARSA